MHIYLQHPKFGQKVAIAEQEAVEDERRGWTRYTPGTPEPAATANALDGRRRRRTEVLTHADSRGPDQ